MAGGSVATILYRGVVSNLSAGWQSLKLPLNDSNDDPAGQFPVDATSLTTVDDSIPTTAPLTLYRLLVNGTSDAGNRLRAVERPGSVEISF